ncbi:unnamed protein product, partial [Polarella glacialis]
LKRGLQRLDREMLAKYYRPGLHSLARLKYLKEPGFSRSPAAQHVALTCRRALASALERSARACVRSAPGMLHQVQHSFRKKLPAVRSRRAKK